MEQMCWGRPQAQGLSWARAPGSNGLHTWTQGGPMTRAVGFLLPTRRPTTTFPALERPRAIDLGSEPLDGSSFSHCLPLQQQTNGIHTDVYFGAKKMSDIHAQDGYSDSSQKMHTMYNLGIGFKKCHVKKKSHFLNLCFNYLFPFLWKR